MRKSIILDDGVNRNVMQITAMMIKKTDQSWSVSNIINSLLLIALRQEITPEKIIKVQDELVKKETKQ